MASVKLSTLFFVSLLICYTLSDAARPGPAINTFGSGAKNLQQGVETEDEEVVVEENCEGVREEECLMRRTLAAHVDYIYTQKHKP